MIILIVFWIFCITLFFVLLDRWVITPRFRLWMSHKNLQNNKKNQNTTGNSPNPGMGNNQIPDYDNSYYNDRKKNRHEGNLSTAHVTHIARIISRRKSSVNPKREEPSE